MRPSARHAPDRSGQSNNRPRLPVQKNPHSKRSAQTSALDIVRPSGTHFQLIAVTVKALVHRNASRTHFQLIALRLRLALLGIYTAKSRAPACTATTSSLSAAPPGINSARAAPGRTIPAANRASRLHHQHPGTSGRQHLPCGTSRSGNRSCAATRGLPCASSHNSRTSRPPSRTALPPCNTRPAHRRAPTSRPG